MCLKLANRIDDGSIGGIVIAQFCNAHLNSRCSMMAHVLVEDTETKENHGSLYPAQSS